MKIQDLNGKSIAILGYGREGRATVEALEKHAPKAKITIADKNPNLDLPPDSPFSILNSQFLADLDRFDVVIKSPGIPPQPRFEELGDKLTNSTQIFLDTVMAAGATVIGVTGTKGKSTTCALLHAILEKAGKTAHLVGNIGKPSIGFIEKKDPNTTRDENSRTVFVLEMSSYQLMHLTTSPQIGVVLNLFPEHLDYHGSMNAYRDAKAHIAQFQTDSDVIFFNAESKEANKTAHISHGTKFGFTAGNAPVGIEETKLIGAHNLTNIAASAIVATHLGIDDATIRSAIRAFEGLPHRLQHLGEHNGITWIDDAICTTPESAIAAIDALEGDVTTIILGGQDRGSDFAALARRIERSEIIHVILIGQTGPRIREAIEETNADVTYHNATSMKEVVAIAKKFSILNSQFSNPTVLLSTASPSYDMFKDFEEKGDQFQEHINQS